MESTSSKIGFLQGNLCSNFQGKEMDKAVEMRKYFQICLDNEQVLLQQKLLEIPHQLLLFLR